MPDEDGFLAVIRDMPSDDIARLVYADWLDERETSTGAPKAEFIRLELRMANEPYSFGRTEQLRLLAERLDPDWLVVISRPEVGGCVVRLDRQCPSVWSRLTPTGDPTARTCDECRNTVRYARSFAEAREFARRGYPTAIAPALGRWTHTRPLNYLLGAVDFTREPLIERPRLAPVQNAEKRTRQNRVEPEEPAPTDSWEPVWGPGPAVPRPPRRQKTRRKHRNIQRENWEEME